MADAPVHPDVAPLAFLLGVWSGRGEGEYPTVEPFAYDETVAFGHAGKPFLSYGQRTTAAGDGRPLHAETGYWRSPAPGVLEVVLAHPTGVVEVLAGTFEPTSGGGVLDLRTASVTCTPSAKEVTALERRFEVDGDELRYTLAMAAVGVPMTHHLRAVLRREA